jgi:CHAT domain-containing protein/tetratricopeptide (TPR) repeat protein
MQVARLTFALVLGATQFAAAADSAPVPRVDQATVLRAAAFFNAGRLVEAEPLYRAILAAVDAGSLPQEELGHCLGPLVKIYFTLGRNDDALLVAERYRAFLQNATKFDAKVRQQELDEVLLELINILAGLARYDDAERQLAEAIDANRTRQPPDAMRRLLLLEKSALLAEAEEDRAKTRDRWGQVVAEGQADIARVERHELPADALPDIAAAMTRADESIEDYPAAIAVQRKLLDRQIARQNRTRELQTRAEISRLDVENRDFAAARDELTLAVAQARKAPGGLILAGDLLVQLAQVWHDQGFIIEAKQRWSEAAAIYEAELAKVDRAGKYDDEQPLLLVRLRVVYEQMGQFRDAIRVGRRLLDLLKDKRGQDSHATVMARAALGALLGMVADFEGAKPLLTDAIGYWRRVNPPAPNQLAQVLNDLGVVERATGSFPQARALFEESLKLRTGALRSDDMRLAYSINNLASVYLAEGEYAKAISLFDRAIDIYHRRGSTADDSLCTTLLNVAMAYRSQGQFHKAREYCQEALKTYERVFGADAPGAMSYYAALTSLDIAADRLDEAAEYNRHAWQLCVANHLDHDAIAAALLDHRARIAYFQHRFDPAAVDWQQALAIQQAAGQNLQVAHTLNFLATIESLRGQSGKAESLYRQALALEPKVQASPNFFSAVYGNLANIIHEGKDDEALALLQQAVKLIETPRAESVLSEVERAEYFSQFASAFDLLVAWNLSAGRIDEAFGFAEQGRNRTFLDQLNLGGVDLRDQLTGPDADRLLGRERVLRTKLGTLRGQIQAAATTADAQSTLAELGKQYAATQDEFAAVWTEIRNANPFYREQLRRGAPIGSLAAIRQLMDETQGLMLFYYLGSKESHLLIIGGTQQPVEVVALAVPDALAASLNVKAGPLTRPTAVQLVSQYLADLRERGGGRGLSGIVHSPKGVMAAEQGTQLAEVLLPRDVRQRIERRGPRGITIVPDGALHQLPFEALLLEAGDSPRYVIDALPPIAYAPSATILMNLKSHPATDSMLPAKVLTAGNPHYPQGDSQPKGALLAAAPAESVARDAFLELGGRLPLLPGTSKECARIAAAFPADRVKRLEWDTATEANVRAAVVGCKYIHLAAHGLVDSQHDNFYGAIALTPGPAAERSFDNDGFLLFNEIHALPLSGCELVVLSACQTNVGPDRPLEAGSTLAQAFLGAGGRRVVCSHWNVDDASTAELMGTFFEAIAKADRSGAKINYAAALQEARKSIRANRQWSSPYYWAPFVLIGPAD